MFSDDVFLGGQRRLAEKWTSPQPVRREFLSPKPTVPAMACQHLKELFEMCQRNDLKLSSTDLIRITCPHCGVEEVCPSVLYEEYEKRHAGEETSQSEGEAE